MLALTKRKVSVASLLITPKKLTKFALAYYVMQFLVSLI